MLTAWVVSLLLWRRSSGESENGHGEAARNPITLLPALGFVLAVAGAAVLVRWAQATFGETGVAWSLFVAGSFDVDAAIITLSILPADAIPSLVASVAIGGTVAVNMVFKMAIAGATARRQGLPAVMALGVSLLVLLASLGWVLGVILE
jgi:uncharacterized membrane protein (DUF4010 family)